MDSKNQLKRNVNLTEELEDRWIEYLQNLMLQYVPQDVLTDDERSLVEHADHGFITDGSNPMIGRIQAYSRDEKKYSDRSPRNLLSIAIEALLASVISQLVRRAFE